MVMRMRQGVRALSAWSRPVDDETAASVLSAPLLALFHKMRRSERQHSLNVFQTLRSRGYSPQSQPALMTAALLHDVGKTRASFFIWERVMVVLVKAGAPDLAAKWGQGEPRGWKRPFAIATRHPEWGAEMVRAAGADPLVVKLIATHQDYLQHEPQDEFERLLAALQAADNEN